MRHSMAGQLRNTDGYSIELFRHLAEAGSFARAAEHVHLDPTALSRRISQLERALGTQLVIRGRKGTSLTPSGRRLYERALELERLLISINNEIRGNAEQLHGDLCLAINPSAMLSFAPGFLAHMQKKFPHLRLHFKEATSPQVIEMVMNNSVDLGIGSSTPTAIEVNKTKLLDDRLTFIFPREHPLLERANLRFIDTLSHAYVVCQTGAGLDLLFMEQARKLGKIFPNPLVVHSYDFVLKLVEAGLAISIVPQLALEGFPGEPRVEQRRLKEKWAQRSLWMYSAWQSPPDAFTRVVADELLGYCKTWGTTQLAR